MEEESQKKPVPAPNQKEAPVQSLELTLEKQEVDAKTLRAKPISLDDLEDFSNPTTLDAQPVIPKTQEEQDLYDSHLSSGNQTSTTTPSTSDEEQQTNQVNQKALQAIKAQQQAHEVSFQTQSESKDQSEAQEESVFEKAAPMSLDEIPNIEDEPEVTYNVTLNYEHTPHKYKVQDFTNFFRTRLKFLEKVIRQHPEMKGVTSISRVLQKKEKEDTAIIGVVFDIAQTKNGNLILTLEDITGQMKVIITKNNPDVFEAAQELIFDEVIGVRGMNSGDVMFASEIVWPDIASGKQIKKAPVEEHAIFLSDVHVGSSYFLADEFQKFIEWIRAETGSEAQKEVARKVKYIFIAGDVVDGIGIYPGQDKELTHTTMEGQYAEFARYLKQIPSDKKIFICPGNHDVVHLAEPQSAFYKEYTQELHEMENVELVSNPSIITIAKTDTFEGIDVLMYHGYSFDFYVANVDQIRNNGGYHRADLIMKFLLKRRHLAPAFKSTPYLPAHKEDPLLIKKVPDIMISGHIHYSSVAHYKGVTMICGSCWQGKTDFQEKLGHTPEPGRVPIVNLKTREVKVLRFV